MAGKCAHASVSNGSSNINSPAHIEIHLYLTFIIEDRALRSLVFTQKAYGNPEAFFSQVGTLDYLYI